MRRSNFDSGRRFCRFNITTAVLELACGFSSDIILPVLVISKIPFPLFCPTRGGFFPHKQKGKGTYVRSTTAS